MIFDTNAFSALVDGDPELEPHLIDAHPPALPVIVLGEFRFGAIQSRRHEEYKSWFTRRLHLFRVLHIDPHTAEAYAEVRLELKVAGRPIPVNDLWIAALARQHRIPVLSRDRHFDAIKGVRRINW